MKRIICALMLTFVMMFAFSVACFAAVSPTQTVLPTDETDDGSGGGGNYGDKSSTSPKTGMELAGACVAVITAAGVAIVAKKKLSETK